MSSKITSTLGFFVNLFNNLFYKNHLIIFVGYKGVILNALKGDVTIEELFIDYTDKNFDDMYHEFLKKYKKFYVQFLLDTKTTRLNRQVLPVVSSLVKINPIDKFIAENYSADDVVAYNVYNVTNSDSEIWNTLIASVKYESPLKELIEYVLNNSYKFSGIYILPLELRSIIKQILTITNNNQHQEDLQFFVTIFQSAGIKLIVKRKNNVLFYRTFEFPDVKSDEYMKGYLEQIISDQILACKDYLKRHQNINKCVILLVSHKLKSIIDEKFCAPEKVIVISPDQLNLQITPNPIFKSDDFHEAFIINLFKNSSSYLAYNNALKQITKYTLINRVIFKPIVIFILALLINIITLKYQIINIESETDSMNDLYYKLAENYRDITKKYPEIYNVSDLVDLKNLEEVIKQTGATPLPLIHYATSFKDNKTNLKLLSWKIDKLDLVDIANSVVSIEIEVKYNKFFDSRDHLNLVMQTYIDNLKLIFPDYDINYQINDSDSYEISNKYIVSIRYVLRGKLGGSDVK